MTRAALSVAMSVYNGAPHLGEAVESILGQTYGDFEFLVMNDGSTDASQDILEDYAKRDSRLRPIYRENKGLVASLNELIGLAQAPLLARMDADDVCLPERFEKQLAHLADHPECGVLGTQMLDIDETGLLIPTTGEDVEYSATAEGTLYNIRNNRAVVSHPTVVMRTHLLRQVGGYHGAFKHCEDFDLWARLASITQIWSLPDKLVKYRHWPHQVSTRFTYEQHFGAAISRLAYFEREAGRPDPTRHWDKLPPLNELDAIFGRSGAADQVRSSLAASLRYSRSALCGEGFEVIIDNLRAGGTMPGAWRTVARLIKFKQYGRAAKLAKMLSGIES